MSITKQEIEQIVRNSINPVSEKIKENKNLADIRFKIIENTTRDILYALRGFIEKNGYDFVDMWHEGEKSYKNLREKNQQNP